MKIWMENSQDKFIIYAIKNGKIHDTKTFDIDKNKLRKWNFYETEFHFSTNRVCHFFLPD